MTQKIAVITGSRAEYGLLYWLLREIQKDPEWTLQLLVTGAHLSPEFGLTFRQIEQDGFDIAAKIDIQLQSDTPLGITQSMALCTHGFGAHFDRLKPDIVVGLGDRFELFSALSAAVPARIPIAHIHGGEQSEGAIDDVFRHAITKLSHLHFVSTDLYRKNVIQMGEHPDRVFNVGALGIDSITKLPLLSKEALEKELNFTFGLRNLMVTFHPATREEQTAHTHFQTLLDTLDTLENTHIIFTKPNADTNGRILITMIDHYVRTHPHTTVAFTSMGQLRYLSTLQYVNAMVGNSSSGIIEMPSFKKATINIGNRQAGRLRVPSIVDCDPQKKSILDAFATVYSPSFQEQLSCIQSPYGTGNTAEKIIKILKTVTLSALIKKRFYSL